MPLNTRTLRTRAAHLRRLAGRARQNDMPSHAATLDTRAAELERKAKDLDNTK